MSNNVWTCYYSIIGGDDLGHMWSVFVQDIEHPSYTFLRCINCNSETGVFLTIKDYFEDPYYILRLSKTVYCYYDKEISCEQIIVKGILE